MQRKIKISGKNIRYVLRRSRRARVMRLTVYGDGALVATLPRLFDVSEIEKFIIKKAKWILGKIRAPQKKRILAGGTRADYLKQREAARKFVEKKILKLNSFYGFSFKRISIRDQKTRWGSCSQKGNLNFNYKIIHLPEEIAEYIVVHELCHLGEFNHSKKFWNLVGVVVPEYKKIRKELQKI